MPMELEPSVAYWTSPVFDKGDLHANIGYRSGAVRRGAYGGDRCAQGGNDSVQGDADRARRDAAYHFHGPAPVGKAAPVEVPLKAPLDSPMKGSAILTDSQAKDLTDGNMYFNIHTAEHKPGEI